MKIVIKFRMWNKVASEKYRSRYFYHAEKVMECLKQQSLYNEDNNNGLGYNHIGDGNVFEQFTGRFDNKGKEIYDGTIVRFLDYDPSIGDEIYSIGVVEWSDDYNGWDLTNREMADIEDVFHDAEVLGNIHENPELLKP